MPLFTHFGVEVVDEHPYQIDRADGVAVHVYDFGLKGAGPTPGSAAAARGFGSCSRTRSPPSGTAAPRATVSTPWSLVAS